MQYLHKRMHLNAGDTVVVDCSHQCNILLMTDSSFNGYRNGGNFEHHGGGGFFQKEATCTSACSVFRLLECNAGFRWR